MPARRHDISAQTHSITLTGQPEDRLEDGSVAESIRIEYFQIGTLHQISVDMETRWNGGLVHWHRTGSELGDAPMWLKMEIGRHQPRWSRARIPGQQ